MQADVAPFLAVPPDPSARDYRCCGLRPRRELCRVQLSGPTLEHCTVVDEFEVLQMFEHHIDGSDEPEAVTPDRADAAEMLELVRETEPRPSSEPQDRRRKVRRNPSRWPSPGTRPHRDGRSAAKSSLSGTSAAPPCRSAHARTRDPPPNGCVTGSPPNARAARSGPLSRPPTHAPSRIRG